MKKAIKFALLVSLMLLACMMMLVACDNEDITQPSDNEDDAHVHSFGEWEITNNPTCFAEGEKTRFCSCGETQTGAIPAT